MQESLALFKEILGLPVFEKTAVAVFYNKKDLFHEKIAAVPLSVAFPEYAGAPGDEESTQSGRERGGRGRGRRGRG